MFDALTLYIATIFLVILLYTFKQGSDVIISMLLKQDELDFRSEAIIERLESIEQKYMQLSGDLERISSHQPQSSVQSIPSVVSSSIPLPPPPPPPMMAQPKIVIPSKRIVTEKVVEERKEEKDTDVMSHLLRELTNRERRTITFESPRSKRVQSNLKSKDLQHLLESQHSVKKNQNLIFPNPKDIENTKLRKTDVQYSPHGTILKQSRLPENADDIASSLRKKFSLAYKTRSS
ncbi:hypothetical protein BC833DRAFT_605187 [Globomyces pollinis-pini]|nr:hypothetical protein BC833DRAFT_605187 [Globomyces pollinis-pini]